MNWTYIDNKNIMYIVPLLFNGKKFFPVWLTKLHNVVVQFFDGRFIGVRIPKSGSSKNQRNTAPYKFWFVGYILMPKRASVNDLWRTALVCEINF